jgi:hypothetical protein
MIRKTSAALSLAGACAFAALSASAPALAKTPQDWTCSDFLKVPANSKANVVYWLDGFNRSAKSNTADVTAESFKHPIGKLVVECRKNQTQNLWDAIVKHFYTAADQIP